MQLVGLAAALKSHSRGLLAQGQHLRGQRATLQCVVQ